MILLFATTVDTFCCCACSSAKIANEGVIPVANIDNVAVTITSFFIFRFYPLFIISLRYIFRSLKYEDISNIYYLYLHINYLHNFTQFNINILIYIRKWIYFNSLNKINNQLNVWKKKILIHLL